MKAEVVQKVREALTPTVSITKAMNLPGGGIAFEVHQEYTGLPWHFPMSKLVYVRIPMSKLVYVRTNDEGEILETKGL